MADDQTFFDAVEGYCAPLSSVPGQTIGLHVSTRADRFDVVVERWGAHRTAVWSTADQPGVEHPPPPDADSHGCRWPTSVEIPIGDDWESGFHLVTMTARWDDPERAEPGRETAHAAFVVRAGDERRRRALLVLATNTWNAYNTWGGRSLYTGGHRVSFGRPLARGILCRPEVERDDRKARPVRFREEPDLDGEIFQAYRLEHAYPSAIGSTGWFTHDRRFVEWAERAGWRFDMAISSDLDRDPSVAEGYDVILSVGHDEYWSAGQRDTVERHVENGGHLATFSGNTMFWQVRLDDVESLDMICHKYTAHVDDPVVSTAETDLMTGMWADPVVGRPEWSLLGGGSAFGLYHRFGRATARGVGGFLVARDDHWLLDGTDLRYGDVLGIDDGVVGYETLGCPIEWDAHNLPVAPDRDDLPSDIEIVASTPSSNLAVGEYPASIAALSDQGDLEFIAGRLYGDLPADVARSRVRHGNAVMLTCRPFGSRGGHVVTIGTTDWVFGLREDRRVSRVTENVLRRLGVDTQR